jgi:putative Mg2+ transporter-C (MgtC) family protein
MDLTFTEVVSRVGMALFAGLVIGIERESHGRAAGLRTTILAGVSSAIAMILSEYLFEHSLATSTSNWRPDPARLAAGILTGMGFLGAGSIIRQDNAVRGLTTAAVLWFVTVLGLIFGSGYFELGLLGLGVAATTLVVLPYFECWVKNDWYGSIHVVVKMDGPTPNEIRCEIEELGVKVKSIDVDHDVTAARKSFRLGIKFKQGDHFALCEDVIERLVKHPEVVQVVVALP